MSLNKPSNVRIWSGKRQAYWLKGNRGQGQGFTTDKDQAGVWPQAAAKVLTAYADSTEQVQLMPTNEDATPIDLNQSKPAPVAVSDPDAFHPGSKVAAVPAGFSPFNTFTDVAEKAGSAETEARERALLMWSGEAQAMFWQGVGGYLSTGVMMKDDVPPLPVELILTDERPVGSKRFIGSIIMPVGLLDHEANTSNVWAYIAERAALDIAELVEEGNEASSDKFLSLFNGRAFAPDNAAAVFTAHREMGFQHKITTQTSRKGDAPRRVHMVDLEIHGIVSFKVPDQKQEAVPQEPTSQEPDGHASDCATHNMPAYPNGPCDCGVDGQTIHAGDIVWLNSGGPEMTATSIRVITGGGEQTYEATCRWEGENGPEEASFDLRTLVLIRAAAKEAPPEDSKVEEGKAEEAKKKPKTR